MAELKSVIAKNISRLRTSRGMTQLELAEELHYSDKAISKWERGESVPEISTLLAIAKLFGVTLDSLVSEDEMPAEDKSISVHTDDSKRKAKNRAIISAMCILIVWFVALLIYVLIDVISSTSSIHWVSLLYALPASMLLWLIFNSVWFNRRRNYLIISLMMWTLIAAVHINALVMGCSIWQFYLLGIPGQIVIFLWSGLKKR